MKSILIIEDNASNLMLTVDILQRANYNVLTATNAEDGVRIATKKLPELILMDIQLPGTDGLTATRQLKMNPNTQHIPVIALTAHTMKGDEEKILAEGCDGYIAKPIRYKAFLKTIGEFINNQPDSA